MRGRVIAVLLIVAVAASAEMAIARDGERLVGTSGDDRLRGHGGNDRLIGFGGDDFLRGRRGEDVLRAGAGDDVLYGGRSVDRMYGGSGRDTCVIRGDQRRDRVVKSCRVAATISARTDDRRIEIYEAVIRRMTKTERWYGAIFIEERICRGGAPRNDHVRCPRSFSRVMRIALLDSLSNLRRVEFIRAGDAVVREDSGVRHSGAIVSVGPIEGSSKRVEVAASAYCGNVCGHWFTLVVERVRDAWKVTGSTGGTVA